ncbi:lytic transglycosylase domain-containing protein [Streptomyces sp. KR80]|uniref:lytic transglycosylase domain-containing protein n=1 Tax=Streptomyces sp. KR80 TaxID=3457426 RepID=UPI003FD69081
MSRPVSGRWSVLWPQAIAGLVAVGATGGMATATVMQLVGESPAVAASAPSARWNRGGGTPPLYPEPPPVILDLPATRPVPWDIGDKGAGGEAEAGRPPLLPAAYGIPARVLAAYRETANALARSQPGCGLEVPLLAAIGRVESGHARGGDLDAGGRTRFPILGPRLDGSPGVMAIRDTDGGAHDGDSEWDRAVGPAQFIPSTWRRWGSDGNRDGTADPHQVDDAWLAAGRYLCTAGGDLRRAEGLRRAVLAYNHSEDYLRLVVGWMRVYRAHIVPSAAAPETAASPRPDKGESPPPDKERSPQRRPPREPSPSPARPTPERPPADQDPSRPIRPDLPPREQLPDELGPIDPLRDSDLDRLPTDVTSKAPLSTGEKRR